MKKVNEIKPKEIKSNIFEVQIDFTDDDKYGLIYKNTYLYIKKEDNDIQILEIDTKNNLIHKVSKDTIYWLYKNNRFKKKDKRKIKMILDNL